MALRKNELISSPHPSPSLKLYRNDSVEFDDAPPSLALGEFVEPDVLARQVCFWGGLVFGCIGAIGAFFPQAATLPGTQYHSFFYLASGGALVLPAIMIRARILGRLSVALGVFFAGLGFLGFLMGAPATLGVDDGMVLDRFYWALAPGVLEFSTRDHVLQEIIGVILVLAGLRLNRSERLGLFD